MIYYSTGISPHLKVKGTPVDCIEQTGEHLLQRGFLVRNLSDLEIQKNNQIEIQQPKEIENIETKPLVKRKGNPNWGKKK
jgi:hypothetical protein